MTRTPALTLVPDASETPARDFYTDDDVLAELKAFYGRINFPAERAAMMIQAFETCLERDGIWPRVVMKDLGFESVRAYRRVNLPKDQRAAADGESQ